MHYGYGGGLSKAVKMLLIINAAVFVVTFLLMPTGYWNALFGLVPYLVNHKFMIWQFFTYMFLHGSIVHIGFNMFGLWMFGTELEHNWGTRDFIKYYLACGVGGGVLVWFTSFFGFSASTVPTIGASGAIWGLLVAYGLMWPDRMILVSFFFPMKARHFVIIFGALQLMQGLGRAGGGVAYFAHIGGGVTGYIYLKYGWRIMVQIESFFSHHGSLTAWFKRKRFNVVNGGKNKNVFDDDSIHPDFDEEVDRILDKIARNGKESLTESEKRTLDRASWRKRQRK